MKKAPLTEKEEYGKAIFLLPANILKGKLVISIVTNKILHTFSNTEKAENMGWTLILLFEGMMDLSLVHPTLNPPALQDQNQKLYSRLTVLLIRTGYGALGHNL